MNVCWIELREQRKTKLNRIMFRLHMNNFSIFIVFIRFVKLIHNMPHLIPLLQSRFIFCIPHQISIHYGMHHKQLNSSFAILFAICCELCVCIQLAAVNRMYGRAKKKLLIYWCVTSLSRKWYVMRWASLYTTHCWFDFNFSIEYWRHYIFHSL